MVIAFSPLFPTFHVHFYLASCLSYRAEIKEDGRKEYFRNHKTIIDMWFGSMTYFRVLLRISQGENTCDLVIQMLYFPNLLV